MTRGRFVRAMAVAAITTALLPIGMPTAAAHTHPATTDLAGPSVVYIESGYDVKVWLIEHNVTSAHINLIKRTYHKVLARGSGFAVDPSAVIATTAAVVTPDEQEAKNYAVNSMFQQTYPAAANPDLALPLDPLKQRGFGAEIGGPVDYSTPNRLRGCYEERTNSAGGCVIDATRFITVYPYVTDEGKYGTLDAKIIGQTPTGIALLRVSAGSMPAATVADIASNTYHLDVFGFDGVPGKDHLMLDYRAHLDKLGGTKFKPPVGDNLAFSKVTPQVLSGGLQGGPVAADLGQVIGMISATPTPAGQPGAGGPTLITTQAIRAALAHLKPVVSPSHGPADANYESAMHNFTNNYFAASVPGFQQALAVYPGHFLAAKNLATAQNKVKAGQGGPSSQPPTPPKSPGATTSWLGRWTWLVVGVAVLIAAAIAAWLIPRRRRPPAAVAERTAGKAPAPKPAPVAPGVDRRAGKPASGEVIPRSASNGAPKVSNSAPRVAASGVNTPASPRGDAPVMARTGAANARRTEQGRAPTFCTTCGGRLAPHHQYCGWCGEHIG